MMQPPLLITTNRGFICIDEHTPEAWLIDGGRGTYYGITYSEDKIFVAARRIAYATGKNKMDDQDGVILVFDYDLKQIDELYAPFRLRDLHQLYYFDGALWAVCTYDCLIATYRDGQWEKWYPQGESAGATAGKLKAFHLNSIYHHAGSIYLGGSINRVGLIYQYRETDRALVERLYVGYSPHNVWQENGTFYTLSSMTGSCVSLAGRTRVVSRGNFIRGVVATPDTHYFGVSESLSRASRDGANCMIRKFPSHGPSSIVGIRAQGQINEIRSPGRQDFAHPSVIGKPIDTTEFTHRFPLVPLTNALCMVEISAWSWRMRLCYQYFDRSKRRRALQASQLI